MSDPLKRYCTRCGTEILVNNDIEQYQCHCHDGPEDVGYWLGPDGTRLTDRDFNRRFGQSYKAVEVGWKWILPKPSF